MIPYLTVLITALSLLVNTRVGATKKSVYKVPFLRFSGDIHAPKVNTQSKYLAYTNQDGLGLKVVDISSGDVVLITKHKVGFDFFWAPIGYRLFYREMYLEDSKIISEIKAYDLNLSKSISLEKLDGPTGFLSFDPRDYRFYAYHQSGIIRQQIKYPGERLAKWQIAQKNKSGFWVPTDNSILWVYHGGISMRQLNRDRTKIVSFDISPDGNSIVWADENEKVYLSQEGKEAKFLARGLDPSWHPNGQQILYAHSRIVNHKVLEHDIRIMDRHGRGKYLTNTYDKDERYPIWLKKSSSVLYTHKSGTDLFEASFR